MATGWRDLYTPDMAVDFDGLLAREPKGCWWNLRSDDAGVGEELGSEMGPPPGCKGSQVGLQASEEGELDKLDLWVDGPRV